MEHFGTIPYQYSTSIQHVSALKTTPKKPKHDNIPL